MVSGILGNLDAIARSSDAELNGIYLGVAFPSGLLVDLLYARQPHPALCLAHRRALAAVDTAQLYVIHCLYSSRIPQFGCYHVGYRVYLYHCSVPRCGIQLWRNYEHSMAMVTAHRRYDWRAVLIHLALADPESTGEPPPTRS